MKRIISILVLLCMMFSVDCFVFAASPLADKTNVESKSPNTIIKELTKYQFIKAVAEKNGISETQVLNNIANNKRAITQQESAVILSSGTRYCQVTTTKDFAAGSMMSMPIELGMYYIEYYDNSFHQINSVESCWTGATGSGLYTWSEYSKVYTNTGFPRMSIEAHARGATTITINTSVSGQIQLKTSLTNVGFTVTATVGTTVYLRKVDNIDLYLNTYPR